MVLKRLIDRRQHVRRKPGLAHLHNRFEPVRESAQVFAI
jgi:hypothetical protein